MAKEANNKIKRQHTEGEKISANDVPDERLTPKIYKELKQLSTKKPYNPIKNGQKT